MFMVKYNENRKKKITTFFYLCLKDSLQKYSKQLDVVRIWRPAVALKNLAGYSLL